MYGVCPKSNLNMQIKQKKLKIGNYFFNTFHGMWTYFFLYWLMSLPEGGGNALFWDSSHYPLPAIRSPESVWGQPAPFSPSGTRRSLPTLDEMKKVMLVYLDCPQWGQSTTGNKKWLPNKKEGLLSWLITLIYEIILKLF